MTTATVEDVRTWEGRTVIDSRGDRIGKVEDVYFDEQTSQPEWALVNTGMLGSKHNFVPLTRARTMNEGTVQIPFTEEQVKKAPSIDASGELSQNEEKRLYEYYGIDWEQSASDTVLPRGGIQPAQTGQQEGRQAPDAMTRSEEELRVGTVKRPHDLVRLRKYVVTENVQQTVPVSHEEIRVEREPITEANIGKAMEGPEITESQHEVTLMEEQPVVEKRVVPKERVRLEKDVVTGEEEVSEEVRKERIALERDQGGGGKR